jgi:acetyl esterase/lipase
VKAMTIELYEDRSDVTITAYVLDDSRELLAGKRRPAVIICPGGGYMFCSDREAEPVAIRFAAMGYHAFVLRYTVHSQGGGGVYPKPLLDLAEAFVLINEHAAEWHVDTERIAICGFSAGGHNCAMYSVYWHDSAVTGLLDVDPKTLRPVACILGYPIIDLGLRVDDPALRTAHESLMTAYLGTSEPSSEMLDAVNPAKHVTAQTPPTFLWGTASDSLLPIENTLTMARALAGVGVPFEVHVFEQGPHGLALADQATAYSIKEVDADAGKWVGLAEEWLKKRLALSLEEESAWAAMAKGDHGFQRT